ncbi:MAG: pentapeptide repeat-containing protein, partial [Waterburya sp.]
GTALIGANFAHANLSKANLSLCRLIQANIANSPQDHSSLDIAKSPKVNFQGANLAGAFFMGVDLSSAQLKGAFFNDKTKFIPSFDPIKAGMVNMKMVEAIALDQLLARFNHLINSSNRFLGPTITTKYFNSSRPDYSWLNQFQINSKNHICFEETVSDFVSLEQLDYFQQWIDSFTQSCSKIIRNFPEEN